MNRENIKRVRNVIAGLPAKRFDMGLWAGERDGESHVAARRLRHDCGTCGCLGGWTNATFGTPKHAMGIESASAKLGLDEGQAQALFFPQGAGCAWREITTAHAVRVLDHLLETGEVDWQSTRRAKKSAVSK